MHTHTHTRIFHFHAGPFGSFGSALKRVTAYVSFPTTFLIYNMESCAAAALPLLLLCLCISYSLRCFCLNFKSTLFIIYLRAFVFAIAFTNFPTLFVSVWVYVWLCMCVYLYSPCLMCLVLQFKDISFWALDAHTLT